MARSSPCASAQWYAMHEALFSVFSDTVLLTRFCSWARRKDSVNMSAVCFVRCGFAKQYVGMREALLSRTGCGTSARNKRYVSAA